MSKRKKHYARTPAPKTELTGWQKFTRWVDGVQEEFSVEETHKKPAHAQPKRIDGDFYWRWINGSGAKLSHRFYQVMGVLVCVTFACVMLYTAAHMPAFGEQDVPTNNELYQRYVEEGVEEVGAVNLVANMILVYRGFDTYGESCVLFLAATCVMVLLRRDKKNTSAADLAEFSEDQEIEKHENNVLLKTVTKRMMPFLLLFGIYVLVNGHISCGGGFAGGSIIGGMLILCDSTFGFKKVRSFFGEKLYLTVRIGALLLYAALIGYTIFVGANGLQSVFGTGAPGSIFSAGIIMPINVAVGLEVACTMYGFYAYFSKGDL